MLIAQTTQPVVQTVLSGEVVAAISAGLVVIIGTAVAAIVALIKAGTAKVEAKLAQKTADAADNTATLAATHAQRIDTAVTNIARDMPPAAAPPATPREHQL